MISVSEQIKKLEDELLTYPNGYISRKMIGGKERFYLQWTENGRLKSKYIKADELEYMNSMVERRKQLQENERRCEICRTLPEPSCQRIDLLQKSKTA